MTLGRTFSFAIVAALSISCGLEDAVPPPVAGPAGLGLALRVAVSPDVLQRDGVSTAQVALEARDAGRRPVIGLQLRAETVFGGVIADVGRLSSKTVTTGAGGRAELTYTAPAQAERSDDGASIVEIRVTPIGDDYGSTVARIARVRLVPPGIVLPPAGTPYATFTVSPLNPEPGDLVQLDASGSRDCPADAASPQDCTSTASLTSFAWLFGDGGSGTGARVTHRYVKAGEYVITLTVTNDRGRSAIATKTLEVREEEEEKEEEEEGQKGQIQVPSDERSLDVRSADSDCSSLASCVRARPRKRPAAAIAVVACSSEKASKGTPPGRPFG